MRYVALLRGINVGGNRKVDMKTLAALVEALGASEVRTYINSGNVIFTSDEAVKALEQQVEAAIEREFGFEVMVLVRSAEQISELVETLPQTWANDDTQKCDVMFLSAGIDTPALLSELTIKPGLDDVIHAPGALLWRVDRSNVTRSGMMKLVGTPLYAAMTVRNCNTLRKIDALMR